MYSQFMMHGQEKNIKLFHIQINYLSVILQHVSFVAVLRNAVVTDCANGFRLYVR
jgi:hypothetical protein